jgi:hypothetical protein
MEIGIDSFAAFLPETEDGTPVPASERMEALLAEVETAGRVGLDAFGIGGHHRADKDHPAQQCGHGAQRR